MGTVADMRVSRTLVVLAAALALTCAGCDRLTDGTAVANGAPPGSAITEDGTGILAGYPDAAVQIEIFTEPQCPGCARLQQDYGKEIADYIGRGELAVTYRPLIFIDTSTDYSARVANAMFLAAGDGTTGTQFQAFVQELWSHQQREGSPGPTDDEMADMARKSGVDDARVAAIAGADHRVDTDQMAEQNADMLSDIAGAVSTPTVYDQTDEELVELDDNWLSELMSRSAN